VIGKECPEDLYRVDQQHRDRVDAKADSDRIAVADCAGAWGGFSVRAPVGGLEPEGDPLPARPTLVSLRHKLGHAVPGMLRQVTLPDAQGARRGKALLFYPVEEVDTLPLGEVGQGAGVEESQADIEDRLDAAHHQWMTSRMPLGLLWITIDQSMSLRKTHGHEACEGMLRAVEQTLRRQMNTAEIIGRWGDDEFLVIAHERTAELLVEHGRRLAGLVRTVDFRWWGDRIGVTASIGASHANQGDTLQSLLHRAQRAMRISEYAGGNHVTHARKE
jgi:diguanylate cyclase (GGDEF)-like protein